MTRRVALAGLLALALTTPARAGYITGVTATTNMGTFPGWDIAHIVDGSGLSSLSLTATHAAADFSNAWISALGTLTGQVTFDLHGAYTLVGMSVWNFNNDPRNGVQGVGVSTSTDGVTFTLLAGGPTTFAQGPASPPSPRSSSPSGRWWRTSFASTSLATTAALSPPGCRRSASTAPPPRPASRPRRPCCSGWSGQRASPGSAGGDARQLPTDRPSNQS
jgi:hypothetical protein